MFRHSVCFDRDLIAYLKLKKKLPTQLVKKSAEQEVIHWLISKYMRSRLKEINKK